MIHLDTEQEGIIKADIKQESEEELPVIIETIASLNLAALTGTEVTINCKLLNQDKEINVEEYFTYSMLALVGQFISVNEIKPEEVSIPKHMNTIQEMVIAYLFKQVSETVGEEVKKEVLNYLNQHTEAK